MLFYPNFLRVLSGCLFYIPQSKYWALTQLRKLTVLGNVCFWLMLVFQYSKWARNIQQDLLNTIVMLGLLAVIINLVWLAILLSNSIKGSPATIGKNKGTKNNQTAVQLFTWFNILSFVSQLIFLFLKFL